jgi:hypothetical protein
MSIAPACVSQRRGATRESFIWAGRLKQAQLRSITGLNPEAAQKMLAAVKSTPMRPTASA